MNRKPAPVPPLRAEQPACDAHDSKRLLGCRHQTAAAPAPGSPSTVNLGIELAVPVGGNPRQLRRILQVLRKRGVKVLAYCTSFDEGDFTIFVVPDDPLAARSALTMAGLNCSAHSVVLVHAAGRTATPAALLDELRTAGIDICYAYVAALDPAHLCAIFKTDDDRRAVEVLVATSLVSSPQA